MKIVLISALLMTMLVGCGKNGADGRSGEDGESIIGSQGIPGESIAGADGVDGIDGESITGEQGIQGASGVDGANGIDGQDSTVAGEQGIQGEQGDSGINGSDGTYIESCETQTGNKLVTKTCTDGKTTITRYENTPSGAYRMTSIHRYLNGLLDGQVCIGSSALCKTYPAIEEYIYTNPNDTIHEEVTCSRYKSGALHSLVYPTVFTTNGVMGNQGGTGCTYVGILRLSGNTPGAGMWSIEYYLDGALQADRDEWEANRGEY